jgi:hypothetical protein
MIELLKRERERYTGKNIKRDENCSEYREEGVFERAIPTCHTEL